MATTDPHAYPDPAQGSSRPSPLDTHRPFTRADAVAAGIPAKVLRTSRYRRIFRGVYVHRSVPASPFVRVQAALAIHPSSAYASHVSAARVYRLPVPDSADDHVTVLRQEDRRPRPGVRTHVARGMPTVVTHRGVRVSAPVDLFIELAALLDLVDLVVVGDALLRVFGMSAAELVRACAQSTARCAPAARVAVGYVRERVDSPMETRLRMLIVLAGLPEPVVDHRVRDENGDVIMRFDLYYPVVRLIVEYDGRQHAERERQWERDLERRELIDEEEWRILVVTAAGIYRFPEQTLERIRRALVSRSHPGVPRHLREDWRPHFPGRR